MPNERTHLWQSTQNEQLARGLILLSPHLMDWAVTACFYTALHRVDGYLARSGVQPRDHQERENWILYRLNPIFREYRILKRLSLEARYDGVQMNSTTAFQPAFVESLLTTELEVIKNYIARLP